MLGLTRQEQLIIIFLVAAMIVGGGVLLYQRFQKEAVNPGALSANLTSGRVPGENLGRMNPTPTGITVHIAGAVKNPGVYELKKGCRVIEGVKEAGGATEKADLDAINLARLLSDGEMIRVPEKVKGGRRISSGSLGSGLIPGKVNLNLAGKSQLESLPGIGPKLAQQIINYRKKNGLFRNIEELKKVPGIGKKKFESLKDLISLN
jgi:competence protein ComEA